MHVLVCSFGMSARLSWPFKTFYWSQSQCLQSRKVTKLFFHSSWVLVFRSQKCSTDRPGIFFSFLFLMLIISRAAGWWDYWRSVCVLGILCPFVHFSNPDKSGSGLRQGVGQDGDGWGAGLASGRLTFSPGADIWIDSLCHGSVIHSCLSFTHTHTQTRV